MNLKIRLMLNRFLFSFKKFQNFDPKISSIFVENFASNFPFPKMFQSSFEVLLKIRFKKDFK